MGVKKRVHKKKGFKLQNENLPINKPRFLTVMPRAPRIESNEGIFHVINRSSYRTFVFVDDGAKASFEKCLFEAAERSGWLVMAYCIMGNHFHLCISTPRGNLSEGMRWLQSSYAARHNRFRREQGHLFQSRFKSLIVEPGRHLCDLIDYIHLNPVRAKLVLSSNTKSYRWSSLHWRPKSRHVPSLWRQVGSTTKKEYVTSPLDGEAIRHLFRCASPRTPRRSTNSRNRGAVVRASGARHSSKSMPRSS